MDVDLHNSWHMCLLLCFKFLSMGMFNGHTEPAVRVSLEVNPCPPQINISTPDSMTEKLKMNGDIVKLLFLVIQANGFPPRRASLLFLGWEKLICCSLGERPSPCDPFQQCCQLFCLSLSYKTIRLTDCPSLSFLDCLPDHLKWLVAVLSHSLNFIVLFSSEQKIIIWHLSNHVFFFFFYICYLCCYVGLFFWT